MAIPWEVSLGIAGLGEFALVYVVLGVSFGWFGRRRWARAPFALAQVLALVVSVPLIGATELLQQVIAVGVTIVALVGTFMAFTPRVTQQLHGDEVALESN